MRGRGINYKDRQMIPPNRRSRARSRGIICRRMILPNVAIVCEVERMRVSSDTLEKVGEEKNSRNLRRRVGERHDRAKGFLVCYNGEGNRERES